MRWFQKKSAVPLSQIADIAGFASGKGAVTERNALQVAAVFCAVRVISEGIAQGYIRVMREEYQGNRLLRTVDPAHPAHRLLAVKPNEYQTPFEFREYAVFCAALGKGFVGYKVKDGTGQVREIIPIAHDAWSGRIKTDGSLEFQVTLRDNTLLKLSAEDVFHLRGPSLDGYLGLSAVHQARMAIGIARDMESQQSKLASNGGKPSGVLSFEHALAPETREKLRKDWAERYGPNGEGGIALLDGAAKFSSMAMSNVDAQFVESRRMQIEEIGRAFRVQPIMLMQADKAATYASAEQMFRVHVTHTLMPWIKRFEEAANRDIITDADYRAGVRVDIDERGLMRGDLQNQSSYYATALGAGGQPAWMSVNDVRTELGLNPSDDPRADQLNFGAMGDLSAPV